MAMQPETVLEPDLPIIDPHHHLWDHTTRPATPPTHDFERAIADSRMYLLPELLADLNSGHNVLATVFIECGSMYRADGPAAMKPVGETEFVNGVAAMSASGAYGPARACAGIVGHADLMLGAAVGAVLDAHIIAGGGRFKGIRHSTSHDADSTVLGPLSRRPAGVFKETKFREGFAELSQHGLSFDAWLLEPQLPELVELAREFPETTIVLDHVGTPLGIASYEGRREERFPTWAAAIRDLAALENVVVKLGGLAMCFPHFPSFLSDPPASSEQLAAEWRPYVETCIQAFGPARCMFESNFPVDIGSCDYRTLWNAFKVLAKGYSAEDKTAMFSGTAKRVYRLDV
jgi:predicted TIM-barrel fold metal-dependent hydrolase